MIIFLHILIKLQCCNITIYAIIFFYVAEILHWINCARNRRTITAMLEKQIQNGFSRYIPSSDEARRWGIFVTDLGYTDIAPSTNYPQGQHPEQYTLNRKTGRILQEHQIVYITRGKGVFWSDRSGTITIRTGSVFLLFPGVRHRYRPHCKTGWEEHWIGFGGDQGEKLMREFFSPEKPVIHTGTDSDLLSLFRDACTLAQRESFGFRPVIAAKTMEIIARIQILSCGEVLRHGLCPLEYRSSFAPAVER